MVNIVVAKSGDELKDTIAKHVAAKSAEAIADHGYFSVAFSGGSMPKTLAKIADVPGVEWAKWHVFFADERCVPLDSEDSNYKACADHFFAKTTIPREQIYTVDFEVSPAEAAVKYEESLKKVMGDSPSFDIIFLGMGPDGHTASLFPGHPLLTYEDTLVTSITDSPKPPPNRITLTFPCINTAKEIVFIATGSSKAPIFKEMLTAGSDGKVSYVPNPPYPAFMVAPTSGVLTWYTDQDGVGTLAEPILSLL